MRIPLRFRIAVTAFAPVFLALWLVAEAGRSGLTATAVLAGLVAAAIALCPWAPRAALVIVAAMPVAQLAGLLPTFSAHDWPVAFGALVPVAVAAVVVEQRRMRTTVWLLAALAVVAVAFGLGLAFDSVSGWDGADRVLRGGPTGSWLSWVGAGSSIGGVTAQLTAAAQIAVAAAAAVAATWLAASGVTARVRARREHLARERAERDLAEARIEQAVVGERARIVRDVHDAMAHSLAIVVAQADGALASGAAEHADHALATIAETARRALSDVRGVLERIDGDGPALGADDIPALVDGVRAAGLEVRLSLAGETDAVPTAVSLAAYRIVQEALTNALRHTAAPAAADVTIDWRGAGAVVLVASTGPQREHSGGAGRGIVGMGERARMLGGWLSAGRSGEEFVVTATLPYPDRRAAAALATPDAALDAAPEVSA